MPAIFSLEVLQAKHGDSLILHFGEVNKVHHIVIDGGPAGVYRSVLKPRLLEIKNKLYKEEAMPISMVMVSHMDDDHVNGILAMSEDMIQLKNDDEEVPFVTKDFWFNSFDDIIGNVQIPAIASISTSAKAASTDDVPFLANLEDDTRAVVASTGQGRNLRDNVKVLKATLNKPFKATKRSGALINSDGKKTNVPWGDLEITILHPNAERLEALQEQWDKDLKKAKKAGDDSIIVASLNDTDTSPFNLSSIVCLVTYHGKTILLTGDARSDDIYAGLKQNDLLDSKGKLHVDILKVPHHGSVRNASTSFYKHVTADHYVVSADGSYENPDTGFLDMFGDTVKKGTLHLTNHDGKENIKKRLDKWLKKIDTAKLKVVFRDEERKSFIIDTLTKVNF